MGKEEQKRFRQKTGKKLIEYVSNLTAINQLSEWAISNDTPPTEAEQKKGQNPEKRDPSQPADAYRGITKSLTIVYFKDDKPMEKKTVQASGTVKRMLKRNMSMLKYRSG